MTLSSFDNLPRGVRLRKVIHDRDMELHWFERTGFGSGDRPTDLSRLYWEEGGNLLASVTIWVPDEWDSEEAYLVWDSSSDTLALHWALSWDTSPLAELARSTAVHHTEARLPGSNDRVALRDGQIAVLDARRNVVRDVCEAPTGARSIGVSSDAKLLFCATPAGLWISRFDTGEKLTILEGNFCAIACHSTASMIATGSLGNSYPWLVLRLWEYDTSILTGSGEAPDPALSATEAFRLSPSGWNEWRQENSAELIKLNRVNASLRDLSHIDLREADLKGATLRRCSLVCARLDGTDLRAADLAYADLTGANLRGANCADARLSGACLRGADLSGANLFRVDLTGAQLDDTDLTGATLGWTILGRNDLRHTLGLNKIRHDGPSVLGPETLHTLPIPLPLTFMRGCGLTAQDMETISSRLATQSTEEYYSCFISYSHTDREFAKRLHERLQAHGINCWLDEHQLLPGDDIYDGIDRGVRLWDKVLLCASKASLTSWWVDKELAIALEKEKRLWMQRGARLLALIPLDLDGFLRTGAWQDGKASEIRRRIAADFRGWEEDPVTFERQFERVVRALRVNPHSAPAPPQPKL